MPNFGFTDLAYIEEVVNESSLVRDGLIMYLDAAKKESYPGYGTFVKDLSGKGYHGTFTSPLWSSANYGVWQFNTSGNRINTSLTRVSGRTTIMAASRYSGGSNGRIISAISNNWLFGHHSNGTIKFYAEGWVVQTGPNDTNWRIYAATIDTAADYYTFWVNGAFHTGNNAGSQGPNNLSINQNPYGELSNGEVGFVMAYDRILTTAEIVQNYRAMKQRYKINDGY